MMKKDMGKREVRRRGWNEDNTNYGHSLSLTERFLCAPAFQDVLAHFNTLNPHRSETSPCAGSGYYGTKMDFTLMESLAFFLFHGFELHLDPGFLTELPQAWQDELPRLQARLSRNNLGWQDTLESLQGGAAEQLA